MVFGPSAVIESGARIRSSSHIEGARVAAGAEVSPYARLRPGADLGRAPRSATSSRSERPYGRGAKANHLAYLGDGSVGAGANIGAGTIFCNCRRASRRRPRVGAGASSAPTSLVAP
ncbi:hypothetical protein [Brevundimonas aurantiaca]|uniref:hypothetical protein n=1 Tax=Brevundimonas aurantiaca TaxID=74316 RepID=UPI002795F9FD|nr:hypothetical protein [Brevundimonas aurantiaca]